MTHAMSLKAKSDFPAIVSGQAVTVEVEFSDNASQAN
jgi:hypothetical protein